MPIFANVNSLLHNFLRRQRVEQELEEEIRSHLELLTDEKIRGGMKPQVAARAARIELGGVEQIKEQVRAVRAGVWLEILLQDARFGLRILHKNPGFAAVAMLTLALGIGANTAIFSVVENMLLHPVPWKDPDRIVDLWEIDPGAKEARQVVSPANFLDWRARAVSSVFDYVAAWHFNYVNLAGRVQPEQIEALSVTVDYFRLLGYEAALGRTFLSGDDQPGSALTVVLSHDFWERRFDADPTVIGRILQIDGEPYVVIGVLPSDFHIFRILNHELDVFVPLRLDAARLNRADNSVMVYARLKKGVSLAQAQSQIDAAYGGLASEYPATDQGVRAKLIPLPRQWTSGGIRQTLLLLQTAVGLVLLIGCSNVAGLLLARGVARHHEIAVRIALGAGRFRLIRQLLTECLLLAFGGTGIGLLLAYGSITYLNRTHVFSSADDFRLNAQVLAFATGLSVLTSVIFGLLPALQSSQVSVAGSMNEFARSLGGGLRSRRLRNLQIVVEVSLATMLLVVGSLVLRSAMNLEFMNRGLNIKNVLTMQVWLPQEQYADGLAVRRFYREVLEGIRALPGVESASAANFPPLEVRSTGVHFTTEEHPPSITLPLDAQFAKVSVVAPSYFKTMGIPMLAGRDFTEQDGDENRGVTIVSEATAHRFWPTQDPIGSRIWPSFSKAQNFYDIQSQDLPLTIVGVVGDIRQDGTADPAGLLQIYVPYLQNPSAVMSLLVRTARNPLDWASAVRNQVWSVDKDQPVWNVRTMDDVVAETFSRRSSIAKLVGIFAALALILSSVGIYGIISYSMVQRTREVGVRMALGARPKDILILAVGESFQMVAVGIAVGIIGGFGATRLLGNLLYGIGPSDPLTYVAVALLLMGVSFLASYIPARRAICANPVVALRYE